MKKNLLKLFLIAMLSSQNTYGFVGGVQIVQDNTMLQQAISHAKQYAQMIQDIQKQLEVANSINSAINNAYTGITKIQQGIADPTVLADTIKEQYESVKANLNYIKQDALNRDYLSEFYGKQWNGCYEAFSELKKQKDNENKQEIDKISQAMEFLNQKGIGAVDGIQVDVSKLLDATNDSAGNDNKYIKRTKEFFDVQTAKNKLCDKIDEMNDDAKINDIKEKIKNCVKKNNTECTITNIDKLEQMNRNRLKNKNKEIDDDLKNIFVQSSKNIGGLTAKEGEEQELVKKIQGKSNITDLDITGLIKKGWLKDAVDTQMIRTTQLLSKNADVATISKSQMETSRLMLLYQDELLKQNARTANAIVRLTEKLTFTGKNDGYDEKKLKEAQKNIVDNRFNTQGFKTMCIDKYGNYQNINVASNDCKPYINDKTKIPYTIENK